MSLALEPMASAGDPATVVLAHRRPTRPHRPRTAQCRRSRSGSFQVFSKSAGSGPKKRNHGHQPCPAGVWSQFASWPAGTRAHASTPSWPWCSSCSARGRRGAAPAPARAADGRRRFPALNVALALLLVVAFALLTYGLGAEFYRCDVLGSPNCD